jgi:CBS domain-containing protein
MHAALELLVEYNVTGLPVLDADRRVVGVVSDFDLLALDTFGSTRSADLFPDVSVCERGFRGPIADSELCLLLAVVARLRGLAGLADSLDSFLSCPVLSRLQVEQTWQAFVQVRKVLAKGTGKMVADVMTANPLVVKLNTNIDDVTRCVWKPVCEGSSALSFVSLPPHPCPLSFPPQHPHLQEDPQIASRGRRGPVARSHLQAGYCEGRTRSPQEGIDGLILGGPLPTPLLSHQSSMHSTRSRRLCSTRHAFLLDPFFVLHQIPRGTSAREKYLRVAHSL